MTTLITRKQIAKLKKVRTETAWRWSKLDGFPSPVKEGYGGIPDFYDRAEVLAFIKANGLPKHVHPAKPKAKAKLSIGELRHSQREPAKRSHLELIIHLLKMGSCTRESLMVDCETLGYQSSVTRQILAKLLANSIVTVNNKDRSIKLAGGVQ